VWRLGRDPEALWVTSTGPRQAHRDGFDLHANLCVPATDRARLEQLCRYLLRPPVAQDRLRLTSEGRIRLALKTPWADGTSHLLLEPLEFLEKLAALIPRSRVNLVLYHGVRAPHARWRPRVVASASSEPTAPNALTPSEISRPERPARGASPRHWGWAQLMRRAFDVDVLACPRGGGRLRLIAAIEDPHVIRQILVHLGLPTDPPRPDPPQPPPAEPGGLLADLVV
jgi:hypothetical protein